jgi:hypothetical protein
MEEPLIEIEVFGRKNAFELLDRMIPWGRLG